MVVVTELSIELHHATMDNADRHLTRIANGLLGRCQFDTFRTSALELVTLS
jgi:hypothetical protein